MDTIAAFGDSVLKGVIYEDEHYRVSEDPDREHLPLSTISSFLEKKNYSRYLCDDGIHPNEKGHKLIAEAIKQHIRNKEIVFN